MSDTKVIGNIIPSVNVVGQIISNTLEASIVAGHTHANKALLDSITVEDLDKFYVHDQMIPAEQWTILHNLHKYPAVTIVDSAGNVVVGDIIYLSLDSAVISLSSGFSGKAYCN